LTGGNQDGLKIRVKKVGLTLKSQKHESGMPDLTETSCLNV